MNDYELADALLELAQKVVEHLRAANDDEYGLLESAHNNIVAARADLDADLK